MVRGTYQETEFLLVMENYYPTQSPRTDPTVSYYSCCQSHDEECAVIYQQERIWKRLKEIRKFIVSGSTHSSLHSVPVIYPQLNWLMLSGQTGSILQQNTIKRD